MAFVNDPTDPANMTPEERVTEITAILAGAILRLRRRAAIPVVADGTSPAGTPLESRPNGLDDCPRPSPDGHRG